MKMPAVARITAQLAAALVLLLPAVVVESQQPMSLPGTGLPNQTDAFYDWGWGELIYGRTYPTVLTVTNKCRTPQAVHFFISDPFFESTTRRDAQRPWLPPDPNAPPVPALQWLRPPIVSGSPQIEVPPGSKLPLSARAMLSIPVPGCVAVPFAGRGSSTPTTCRTVVQPGDTPFDVTIRTPPPPDLSRMIVPPGFDPSTLFDEIAGQLVAYSPGQPPLCYASREEYVPWGHVHVDPDPKPPAGGAPRCREWWDREKKPQGLTDDCNDEIRDLALAFRHLLESLIAQNPDAWRWLPSADQIKTMTAEQLVAMKIRARAQMRK